MKRVRTELFLPVCAGIHTYVYKISVTLSRLSFSPLAPACAGLTRGENGGPLSHRIDGSLAMVRNFPASLAGGVKESKTRDQKSALCVCVCE